MPKVIYQPTWQDVFKELKIKSGKLHLGMPSDGILPQENDVVLLEQWTPQELLKLARLGVFQVAVLQPVEKEFPMELIPFIDWIFPESPEKSELEKFLILKDEAQKNENPSEQIQAALFLDRDGVVNVDHGYVGSTDKVELMPGVSDLIAKANHHKIKVVVVTNQSGVGRGLYTMENYREVMACLELLLSEDQARIDHAECSPFHPSSQKDEYKLGRQFRKPRPGMIHRARLKNKISLLNSIMIGDRATDLKAAVLAGVKTIYLFDSDQSPQELVEFQGWIDKLKYFHGLNLMDGVAVRSIAGFREIKV